MDINDIGGRGPYYSPDDWGGASGTTGPGNSESSIDFESKFYEKVIGDARSFLFQKLAIEGIKNVEAKIIDGKRLEILPKRGWASFFKRDKPLEPEFLDQYLDSLNKHFTQKNLGNFVLETDLSKPTHTLSFNSEADLRQMQGYYLGKRDVVKQLAQDIMPDNRKISKKEAFLLYQAMNVLEGSDYSWISRTGDTAGSGRVRVYFDGNVFANDFLEGLSDSVKETLGLEIQKTESNNVFYMIFKPDWENSLYSKYDSLSSTDTARVEEYFNVFVKED
jgi:hypothetical protein